MTSQSQTGQRRYFDALIIGSGIAGLSYALELAKLAPTANIALISKKELSESNSFYAQGGVAAAQNDDKSILAHVNDTLKAGAGLSSKQATEKILSHGSEIIHKLTAYGVPFDANHLAQEGGHSERRVYRIGDYSGKAIIEHLCRQVEQINTVTIFSYHTAVNLMTRTNNNTTEVVGAYILNQKNNRIDTFLAKVTVLATGGAGKMYQYTSNPATATGDGIAMAHRVGAEISNMEFYQFHPTLLYHEQLNHFLISEVLRGEGAYLRRPTTLERFMQDYAPSQMEMATRDIVSRAIFNEIDNSEYDYVYLDIRHQPASFIQRNFPNIYQTLSSIGIDITKNLIPVVPAAHYLCGGISTDIHGQTNLSRLYAIGETACTGLHGANRLASNSLLEGAVMADYAAASSVDDLQRAIDSENISDWDSNSIEPSLRTSEINAHWRGLRSDMTSYAGIIRNAHGLRTLLKLIQQRREIIEEHYWQHVITSGLIEIRNMLLVAELVAGSALQRKESRGGHYRSDFPEPLTQQKNSIAKEDV